ncbi:MAG: 16S rRNA (uracil(1498)-N(3))-methyltransferase [Chitinophagales bacterium]|nr:16S rRNA (uracil(1498)-N(3))-methyltransferase [Chitinophagales bacterium]
MALPFFYIGTYDKAQKSLVLDEDTSRHIVQVLRMKAGERLHLTDGLGHLLLAEIADDHKKHCTVSVREVKFTPAAERKVSIAISNIKNASRFEWFLEKAGEIGVTEIIPLVCERTEKERFRHDRMNAICISAMLQSQQVWLPRLSEPQAFKQVLEQRLENAKFIAHCEEGPKNSLAGQTVSASSIILIGPEGDFTPAEIDMAIAKGFMPVTLGETRLRTETAGIVAAVWLVQTPSRISE